jgi:hypothetical protein
MHIFPFDLICPFRIALEFGGAAGRGRPFLKSKPHWGVAVAITLKKNPALP